MTESKSHLWNLARPGRHIAAIRRTNRGDSTRLGLDEMVALRESLISVADDDDVKTVVIGTESKHFCSGLRISDAAALYDEAPGGESGKYPSLRARLWAHDHHFWGKDGLYTAIKRCPKVVILANVGNCYGPGLFIALCSDIVVSGESGHFGNPRWHHLGADGDMMMLINAVGLKRARAAALLGTFWDAQDARRVGLIDEVVPDRDAWTSGVSYAEAISGAVRDGLAAEKYLSIAADEKAQVGTGFAIATLMGAMASNIHFREGEFNLLREYQRNGPEVAVRKAIQHFESGSRNRDASDDPDRAG